MFRISFSSDKLQRLTNAYLAKYKTGLRKEIIGFLQNEDKCIYRCDVGRSNRKTLWLKADAVSKSYTYLFLKRCSDPNDSLLDDLLIGDIPKQLSIIRDIINRGGQSCFDVLNANKASKFNYSNGQTVDDFNAIMHEVFVKRSFDGADNKSGYVVPLDKDSFIKDLGIRLCPYCGRSYIYRVEKTGVNGRVAVKPQLDHFLPKQRYPFLAMNFYNLIPCCSQCNMAPCKVNNDPLDSSKQRIQFLMHPYSFDENAIRFFFLMNSPDTFNSNSFDILTGYRDKDHKQGYNQFLAIDKLYAEQRVELKNMFVRAQAYRVLVNGQYKSIGITNLNNPSISHSVLGFTPMKSEEDRQLMYKFYKDTFYQMISLIGHMTVYYADYNDQEVCCQ